jgi:hypothetical protein
MRRTPSLVALAFISATLLCGCSNHSVAKISPKAVGGPSTFLAVVPTPAVIKHGQLIRYGVNDLQLRSASSGQVRRVVFQSLVPIDAVVAPDGSIIVAIDYQCRTSIERIAPDSGKATILRTLPGALQEIALNPAGTELAYLTHPGPPPTTCASDTQPKSPQPFGGHRTGLAEFGPSVLGTVNLGTGATRATATNHPGFPLLRPSWSPDGTQITAGYGGPLSDHVLVMPASDPQFKTARHLSPPAGCVWLAPVWTASGIVAVEGCGGQAPELSPQRLVQLGPAGQITNSWPLPACINGIGLYTDSSHTHVLIDASIGYGGSWPCGVTAGDPTAVIATINGPTLATIAELPHSGSLTVIGW